MPERPVADRHASTPAELKSRLEAERRGAPFLEYRDGDGHQLLLALEPDAGTITIGRRSENGVAP